MGVNKRQQRHAEFLVEEGVKLMVDHSRANAIEAKEHRKVTENLTERTKANE